MSVTHPTATFETTPRQSLASDRQQLLPALIGAAIAAVTILISVAFTGLPH
jgi:hypothetical protein